MRRIYPDLDNAVTTDYADLQNSSWTAARTLCAARTLLSKNSTGCGRICPCLSEHDHLHRCPPGISEEISEISSAEITASATA